MENLKRNLLFEFQRCNELYLSQALTNDSVFTQSVFIEVIIRLDYLLQKLNSINNRITWPEDISNKSIDDITDLVNKIRNAICHFDSKLNYIDDSNKFVFNIACGKMPNAYKVGDIVLGCDYEDDIAFFYGDYKIYLKRHIERLLKQLPDEINKLK